MGACKAERAASTTRYFGVPESSLLSPGFPGAGGVGVVDGGAGWGAEADGGAAGAGCADGVVTARVFLSGRYSGPFCPQPAASHAAPSAARQIARLIRTSGACHAAPASRAPGGR